MSEPQQEEKMKRQLGWPTATALVVGCVIGAGVFFKPYAIYQATGGAAGMGIAGWVIGGLVSIFAALTFAEVAVLIPKTGGMVAYLSEAYGEKVGFLAGWMQIVIFYPAFLAGYGVKVGDELATYFGAAFALPIGIAVIVALVAINCLGAKSAGGAQVVTTICKLVPLVLLIVFGFAWGQGDNLSMTPLVAGDKQPVGALGSVLLAVLFAFEGWTNVGTIAGEMKHPARDLPRAIVGGVSIIMAVYLLINLAYLWVIPADELMLIESPAVAVASNLFGPAGGTLVKVGIIISVIGAGNGFLMAGSRVVYLLACRDTLPGSRYLSKLNASQVPDGAIIFVGALACLYSFSGGFDFLTDLGVFSCWMFYTLTFACVIHLRRTHPEWKREYRVPGYPIVPALAILSGLYVIASQLFFGGVQATLMSLASVGITLLGLPVYAAMKRRGR